MFRQVCFAVVGAVLIVGIGCRPTVRKAGDESQAAASSDPQRKKPEEIEGLIAKPASASSPVEPKNSGQEAQRMEPTDGGMKPAPSTAFDRGSSSRKAMLAGSVGSRRGEQVVRTALVWLAKHQSLDGSWSLHDYTKQCTDKTCTGQSDFSSDAGATALGLLPFLAAGQTHKSPGRFKEPVRKAIDWLIAHQQPDGNLAKGSTKMMYGHGLAAMALSEAYALSGDKRLADAAQAAVNFIVAAQNPQDGGWGYNPKEPGNTSVFGWQLLALKSAKMAGLQVDRGVITRARKYLDSAAVRDGTEYAYRRGLGSSASMTAVGLLCRQYLSAKRDDPMLRGGEKYLLDHLPDENFPNVCYCYYGQNFMHNMSGYEWDTWNKTTRDLLVRTQIHDTNSCADGSWDPAKDAWGTQGGRLMETSLSVLPLEVYYHGYLPLYKPLNW
jgi:hypothetical protein